MSNDEIDDLEAWLADALAHETPAEAIRFARESHRLIDFEAELAVIASDSLVDAAGVRDQDSLRTLSFAVEGINIVIEAEGLDVTLAIAPIPRHVEMVTTAGSTAVAVDDAGMATFQAPRGPCQIVARNDTGQTFATDWFVLAPS